MDSTKKQKGVVVILAVLLMGIFLSIVLTLTLIFSPKIRTAGDIKRSVTALYAADGAVEWCLYVNRRSPPQPTPAPPTMNNSAVYINGITGSNFVASNCLSLPIRAVGTYQGVTRSLEISF